MSQNLSSAAVVIGAFFFSGNFITDIILEAVPADICMLNSGTFRSDRIHSKGPFKLRDLMTILPMVDLLCVIEISGIYTNA